MTTGTRRRTATTALTLTMAGTLGLGLMAPPAGAAGGPCYDGRCKTSMTKDKSVSVSSEKFGFGKFRTDSVASRKVKFSARTSGTSMEGSTSPGGTVQFNNPKIWVKSVSGDKANIQLFPTEYRRSTDRAPTMPSAPGVFISRRGPIGGYVGRP